ncbi:hypothetical protein DFJ74DRAFT_712465 [Hyaloraphidium curvatum]|nr:hypothetical protein DFJ74DRAFT_712465 [Hyaloraphidium curvatum]
MQACSGGCHHGHPPGGTGHGSAGASPRAGSDPNRAGSGTPTPGQEGSQNQGVIDIPSDSDHELSMQGVEFSGPGRRISAGKGVKSFWKDPPFNEDSDEEMADGDGLPKGGRNRSPSPDLSLKRRKPGPVGTPLLPTPMTNLTNWKPSPGSPTPGASTLLNPFDGELGDLDSDEEGDVQQGKGFADGLASGSGSAQGATDLGSGSAPVEQVKKKRKIFRVENVGFI